MEGESRGELLLGLDVALAKTGWGIVELEDGTTRYVGSGTISTSAKTPLSKRLLEIHRGIVGIVGSYVIGSAAIEEVFVGKNIHTGLKLGMSYGVALAALGVSGVDAHTYTARDIKKSVTGDGGASKEQMAKMIKILCRLPHGQTLDEHQIDALAIALCHHMRASSMRRLVSS